MFATLAGGYPRPADLPPDEALRAVLEAQVEAGLGLLADGLVHPADTVAAELVAAWEATRDAAAAIAPGMPVKVALWGPFAARRVAAAPVAVVALRAGLLALAEAGCPVVEVHEPDRKSVV